MNKATEPALGFTLIELLIVVAIVSFLYLAVLPSYARYIKESRRVVVQEYMLDLLTVLEKRYTRQGEYPASLAVSTIDYYTFDYEINSASAGLPQGSTYMLKATPIAAQADDTCGILSIDSTGSKNSNLNSATVSTTQCWEG